LELAQRNSVVLRGFEDYFDEICAALIAHHSEDPNNPLQKKHIKLLYNKHIYGGGIKQWAEDLTEGVKRDLHGEEVVKCKPIPMKNYGKGSIHPRFARFAADCTIVIDSVYRHNPDVAERV
jgi:hypothetical protein